MKNIQNWNFICAKITKNFEWGIRNKNFRHFLYLLSSINIIPFGRFLSPACNKLINVWGRMVCVVEKKRDLRRKNTGPWEISCTVYTRILTEGNNVNKLGRGLWRLEVECHATVKASGIARETSGLAIISSKRFLAP